MTTNKDALENASVSVEAFIRMCCLKIDVDDSVKTEVLDAWKTIRTALQTQAELVEALKKAQFAILRSGPIIRYDSEVLAIHKLALEEVSNALARAEGKE